MPQVDIVPRRTKKPLAIAVGVGAVVVVALIMAAVYYIQWLSAGDARYAAAVKTGDLQSRYLDYKGAVSTYENYLKSFPSADHKYRAEIKLAEVYQQKEDYAQTIVWMQKAEKDGTSMDLIVKPGIAEAAQELGNKDMSIKYYKESIELLRKSNTTSAAQVAGEYEAGITSQGGSLE